MKEKPDEKLKNFLQIASVESANKVDLRNYRLERYSKSKGAYLFVKRRWKVEIIDDGKPNFIEVDNIDGANDVCLDIYRFERFVDEKSVWVFVKRRVIEGE